MAHPRPSVPKSYCLSPPSRTPLRFQLDSDVSTSFQFEAYQYSSFPLYEYVKRRFRWKAKAWSACVEPRPSSFDRGSMGCRSSFIYGGTGDGASGSVAGKGKSYCHAADLE
jgi:hypothetical protein